MPSPLENESIGDWNNIKGTEYHFVYALWLLLYRKVPSVAFYKGNDLLARPILPPKLQRVSSIVPLRIQQQSPQEDIWIQLKATKTPWTLRELQQGNLLANFLYNALFSENEKRVWRIQLITQAELRTDALNDFIKSPAKHPDFKNHINKIMIDVQQRWQDTFHITVDKSHLKSFMHFILQQLTETYPVPLEVLKAQIETQIAYQRPDPEGVREIGQRLLGALLVATGQGPDKATDYTAEWLEEVTGLPLVSGTLLTNDPVQASIESLKLSLPPTWNPQHFVSRPLVDEALGQFLSSTKTLFVLVGMSGVGKSWMATHWTTQVLKRHICLLFRGSDLYGYRGAGAQELNMLIASRLRSYAPADWSNETILRRVLPTPVTDDFHRHLIIVIDDLRFPSNPEESRIFIQYLGRLIEKCRGYNIKLIVTCQRHIWNSYSLHREIQIRDLFSVEPDPNSTPLSESERDFYSFSLMNFTDEEIHEVLKQWLPADSTERIALLLNAPGFGALQNPYILTLYLDQHGASLSKAESIPLVEFDTLLGKRIKEALYEIVERVGCDQSQIAAAFQALLKLLWEARPVGLPSLQVLEVFKSFFWEHVEMVLQEFRRVGLLTIDNRFVEPIIADHLFAQRLLEKIQHGEIVYKELHLGLDNGVVLALLRMTSEPITCAEQLLAENFNWLPTVADGLAQRSSEDYQILAFLSVLAQPEPNIIGEEACDALGQLASRGGRAWIWIEQMYLSDRMMERFRGERALATAIEYAPDRVEKVIQQRLASIAQLEASDSETKGHLLRGAFNPLLRMKHPRTAEVGRRLLNQYGYLVEQDISRHSQETLRDLDFIRGQIALVLGGEEMQGLLADLQVEDPLRRSRAAYALRAVVFEHPESVQETVCEAICREKDEHVMNRLLWSAYRLGERAADRLLDAVEASFVTRWQEPSLTTGITLVLLADVVHQYPSRVRNLLPDQLDAHEPRSRALHCEILAYAWWRCSEYEPQARTYLDALTESDLIDTPSEFRLFALRGAVIAQLGTICLELNISSTPLLGRQSSYPIGTLQFFYLNLTDFIQSHAAALKAHQHFAAWHALLELCIREEEQIPVHPGSELRNARYLCALSCKGILRHLDSNREESTWSNSADDRSYPGLEHFGRIAEFTALVHVSLSDIISFLNENIRDEADLPLLYYWKEAARSWPSLLISRIYARMFDTTFIDKEEALELSTQMLAALGSLPLSRENQQHISIYQAIKQSLQGKRPSALTLPLPSNMIQRTYTSALSILTHAQEEKDAKWLFEALYDRQGWWDTVRYQLEDHSVSFGTHVYTMYVFPAVRLASIAAGRSFSLDDPAAQFVRTRIQAKDVLREHWLAFDGSVLVSDQSLQEALTALEEQLKQDRYDERLWQYRGLVLLRLGRLVDAEKAFQYCLSLSWCTQDTRMEAYYNLACVYAKRENENECKKMLQTWIPFQSNNEMAYQWLRRDPDFEMMRDKIWFRELCNAQ